MTSKMLINEPPLLLLPSLATRLGEELNKRAKKPVENPKPNVVAAVVLQQIHYWLLTSKNIKQGRKWTYNSYTEWREELGYCWSVSTIKRAIRNLEKLGMIDSKSFNQTRADRTKWYAINYDTVDSLAEKPGVKMTPSTGQNDPSNGSECADVDGVKMTPSNLRETSTIDISKLFEEVVEKYPGIIRLPYTEFSDFKDQHENWAEILPMLLPALERQIKERAYLKNNNSFVPPWKHFKKWIEVKGWEERYPVPKPPGPVKPCSAEGCERGATITIDGKPWCSSRCHWAFTKEEPKKNSNGNTGRHIW